VRLRSEVDLIFDWGQDGVMGGDAGDHGRGGAYGGTWNAAKPRQDPRNIDEVVWVA